MLLALALPAYAQVEQPPRSMHGLFGGPPRDSKTTRTFDANVSLFEAYDDDVLASQGAPVGGPQFGGSYSGVSAGVTFAQTGQTFDFGAVGSLNYRYYPTNSDLLGIADQAGVTFGVHGQHARLQAAQAFAYQPFFSFAPFAPVSPYQGIDVQPPSINTVTIQRMGFMSTTSLTGSYDLGPRTVLSGNASLGRTEYTDENSRQYTDTLGGRLSHHLTESLSLRLGYTYTSGHFSGTTSTPLTTINTIDAGVDYNKALGLTRRTRMGFSTGSAIVAQGGQSRFELIGGAWITRDIARTWSANASYQRSVTMLEGFTQPALLDSVTAMFGGQLSHRVDLRTTGSYSKGVLNPVAPSNNFTTSTSSTRLRYAFTQALAVYGEYVVYRYQFDNTIGLPRGFASHVVNQGVRGGLTLWVPLIR